MGLLLILVSPWFMSNTHPIVKREHFLNVLLGQFRGALHKNERVRGRRRRSSESELLPSDDEER